MNTVILKGIPQDIQFSHTIDSVDYYQCNLYVQDPLKPDINDVIKIKFKQFSNKVVEGEEIQLYGNLRSHNSQNEGGKATVELYVYTYFDPFENVDSDFNYIEIDGRICKTDILWKNKVGKHSYHFILANNIYADGRKINSYLNCAAYGKVAIQLSKLPVNTKIKLFGRIHSRTYNKKLANGEIEIKVTHEIIVNRFEIIE